MVVPFVSLGAATNATPSPRIADVDIPDAVTIGESFEVQVTGVNDGGRGGHYSTITVSSPTLDAASDTDQIRITDDSDHAYGITSGAGETLYDRGGNEVTAQYALAEAGSTGDTYWNSDERRDLSVEFTPEETGTFVVYVRVTMPDDDDQEQKSNSPSSGATRDQQDFYVRQYEVEVREESNIQAMIDSFSVDTGTYTPSDTVTAETVVTNTGNREHTFYVGYSLIGPNGDEYANGRTTHEPVTLRPEESDRVGLEWDVPDDAPKGEYEAITSVWKRESDGRLHDRYDSQSEDGVEVVSGAPEARITGFDPPRGEYSRGDRVTATVTVENTGSVANEFRVDGSAYTPDNSWSLGTGESVSLAPNEARPVQVSWTVPSDATRGEYGYGAAVYASGSKDDRLDGVGERDRFEVTAPEPAAEIVSWDPATGTYAPDETVVSTIVVRNTGDTDFEYIVGYSALGPDGDEYTNQESTHEAVYIPAGEQREVELRWEVPAGGSEGAYDLLASVWEAETSDGLTGRQDSVRDRDAVRVEGDGQGAIQADFPRGDVELADVVETDVYVQNTGSREETFYVGYAAVGPDGDVYDTDATTHERVTVPGNDGTWVTVSWTVPSDAPAGSYDLRAALWKSKQGDELDGLLDRSASRDSVEVVSSSIEIADIELSSDQPQRDSEVTIEVTLTNHGQQRVDAVPVTASLGDRETRRETDVPASDESTIEIVLPTDDVDSERLTVEVSRESDAPIVIDRRIDYRDVTATLQGTVVDEGTPISETSVRLFGSADDLTEVTGVDGEFRFTDLEPGTYTIYVSGESVRNDVVRDVQVSDEHTIEVSADAMPPADPVSITGRVVTDSGNPAPKVTVKIEGESVSDELTTDSDGTFVSDAIFQPGVTHSIRIEVDGKLFKWRTVTPDRSGGSYAITIQDASLAGRQADEEAEEWRNSESASEAFSTFASYASSSVKRNVFSGVIPNTYRMDELYGPDTDTAVDYTSPCRDMAVTASTSCLAYSNQVKHDRSIGHYGSMLGAAKGLADSIEAIKNLPQALMAIAQAVSNPIETITGMVKAAVWLGTHPEALDDIVDRLPQSVIDAQKADNPFPEKTDDHQQFADAWYTGYVVYFATELVATGGTGKAVKGSKAASRFGDNVDSAKAYLKTVGGRDRLTAYIRNPRLLEDPTDHAGYSRVIRGTGDDGATFRSKLSDEELALFLKLEDTAGIPRERLEQFVRLSGEDGADLVAQVLDRGDSEMLRWLFTIDDTDRSIDWNDWRSSVASKYAVSKPNKENIDRPPVGVSHDELKAYVGAVYRVSESDRIRGHEDYIRRFNDQTVSRDGRQGYSDTMSSITSEAETALDYARRDSVDDIVTEPELRGTDKDIDVYVRYTDGSSEYIEAKEWTVRTDSSRGENLKEHLFGDGNAVNSKFGEATDVDGTRVAELIVTDEQSRDAIRSVVEEVIRERDGDIHFDEIRVRFRGTDESVRTGTISGNSVTWNAGTDPASSLSPPNHGGTPTPINVPPVTAKSDELSV